MLHILTSILLTTISSEPLSFTNLPHTSLTEYRGTTSCNSAISGTFPANTNYTYHAYKLSELNGIGCTIFANLTSPKLSTNKITRSSILIYTSTGELYGTSSASFTNKHQSTYYILFDNSKSKNSHNPISYKYTLECAKKCNHKWNIPRTIRRMASGSSDDDAGDVSSGGGAASGASEESGSIDSISGGSGSLSISFSDSNESFSSSNDSFDGNFSMDGNYSSDGNYSISFDSSDSNETSISFDSISNDSVSASASVSASEESEESEESVASISEESVESVADSSGATGATGGDSSDAVVVVAGITTGGDDSSSGGTVTTAPVVAVPITRSGGTVVVNNNNGGGSSGSSDDALFVENDKDDGIMAGNNNEHVKTYDIVINFSKTAVENLWAVFLVFVAINCAIAWCYYKRGYKKRKYVHDNLPSNHKLP